MSNFNRPGVTFNVENVVPATKPEQARKLVDALRSEHPYLRGIFDPNATIVGSRQNGLLGACHLAFQEHFPLTLDPDSIWMAILLGFSNHVNLHAEKLRRKFVSHEGKKRLMVYAAGIPGEGMPWSGCIQLFTAAVAEHIGTKTVAGLLADFSTTDEVSRICSASAVCEAMQQYFDYCGMSVCGIPKITLQGTTADWKHLAAKTAALLVHDPDLAWWLVPVGKILDQFVAASQGDVNVPFWTNIYKWEGAHGSGSPSVSGWITSFMPYLLDLDQKATEQSPFAEMGDDFSFGEPMTPTSTTKVSFKWITGSGEKNYRFYGGIIGAEQDPVTLAVRPQMGWYVEEDVYNEDDRAN